MDIFFFKWHIHTLYTGAMFNEQLPPLPISNINYFHMKHVFSLLSFISFVFFLRSTQFLSMDCNQWKKCHLDIESTLLRLFFFDWKILIIILQWQERVADIEWSYAIDLKWSPDLMRLYMKRREWFSSYDSCFKSPLRMVVIPNSQNNDGSPTVFHFPLHTSYAKQHMSTLIQVRMKFKTFFAIVCMPAARSYEKHWNNHSCIA